MIAYDARGPRPVISRRPIRVPTTYRYDLELTDDLEAVMDGLRDPARGTWPVRRWERSTLLCAGPASPRSGSAGVVVITPAFVDARRGRPNPSSARPKWDALSELGCATMAIDGFLAAQGELARPRASGGRRCVKVISPALVGSTSISDAVADALHAVPRSAPFASLQQLGSIARARRRGRLRGRP